MRRRGTWAAPMVAAWVLLGSTACGGSDDAVDGTTEVAVCDDLRRRENELITVANDALAALADADGDEARAAALRDGFDRLVETAAAQVETVADDEPELAAPLRAGAEAAVAELEDERDRFTSEVQAVPQADEHGRAGQLQNALEKAFSHLEPPRRAYVDAGLGGAIDDDPDCRFVTQRADPAR